MYRKINFKKHKYSIEETELHSKMMLTNDNVDTEEIDESGYVKNKDYFVNIDNWDNNYKGLYYILGRPNNDGVDYFTNYNNYSFYDNKEDLTLYGFQDIFTQYIPGINLDYHRSLTFNISVKEAEIPNNIKNLYLILSEIGQHPKHGKLIFNFKEKYKDKTIYIIAASFSQDLEIDCGGNDVKIFLNNNDILYSYNKDSNIVYYQDENEEDIFENESKYGEITIINPHILSSQNEIIRSTVFLKNIILDEKNTGFSILCNDSYLKIESLECKDPSLKCHIKAKDFSNISVPEDCVNIIKYNINNSTIALAKKAGLSTENAVLLFNKSLSITDNTIDFPKEPKIIKEESKEISIIDMRGNNLFKEKIEIYSDKIEIFTDKTSSALLKFYKKRLDELKNHRVRISCSGIKNNIKQALQKEITITDVVQETLSQKQVKFVIKISQINLPSVFVPTTFMLEKV